MLRPDELDYDELVTNFPADIAEKSKQFVTDALAALTQRTQRLTSDVSDFHSKKRETQKRIRRGARRTSGRIV
jgi:hypothetical protein